MKKYIWIVVWGESYVPEVFTTKREAEAFVNRCTRRGDDVHSGPWQAVVS